MKAYDFEYDGIKLSEFGFIICKFDSSGMETIENGSPISFNTISTFNGKKNEKTSLQYDECLKATIQICKDNCSNKEAIISIDELRKITSWLNRSDFKKLKILNDEYIDIYFEASFNISVIESSGNIVGLELSIMTNRPFGLQEHKEITIRNTQINGEYTLVDSSDEEGFIYPDTSIEIQEAGTLTITNEIENRITEIKNCQVGEIITMNYPIVESSLNSHKIQNDFNWNFFRIANSYNNNNNNLTISLPCIMRVCYSPIAKVSIY